MSNREIIQYLEENRFEQLLLRLSVSYDLTVKFTKFLNSHKKALPLFKKFYEFCLCSEDGRSLLFNSSYPALCAYIFKNKLMTFDNLIDYCKTHGYLYSSVFDRCAQDLSDEFKIERSALERLLTAIESQSDIFDAFEELDALLCSNPLVPQLFEHNLLTRERIEAYNELLEKRHKQRDLSLWYTSDIQSYDVLSIIEYYAYTNEIFDWLKVCSLSLKFEQAKEQQFIDLMNLLKTDQIAQDRMSAIVQNNIQSQFTFETLIQHLTKTEKKNLLNI